MIVKHGAGQRLQGLRGVRNVCVGRDIHELRDAPNPEVR